MSPLRFALTACALLCADWAGADSVSLKNGDRISGSIMQTAGSALLLKTEYAGIVVIQWDKIEGLISDAPVTLQLKNGSILKGRLRATPGQTLNINGGPVALPEVKAINPEGLGEIDPQIKLTGSINLGASLSTGNTQRSQANLQAEVVARRAHTRLSAGGTVHYSRDGKATTGENYSAHIKYDRFRSDRWFGLANLTLSRDTFRDVQLRSALGAGIGYQFLENATGMLSSELGLSYVLEQHQNAEDESYPALRWAVDFDYWLQPKLFQLFYQHEYLQGLSDTSDRVATASTGLRVPLRDHWQAGLAAHLNWDFSPAPGAASTDLNYLFTLGYRF